jgi:predicted nucleic acid-binding protein
MVDRCIAEAAIERVRLPIHSDRDFETIATVRPLKHLELGQP